MTVWILVGVVVWAVAVAAVLSFFHGASENRQPPSPRRG